MVIEYFDKFYDVKGTFGSTDLLLSNNYVRKFSEIKPKKKRNKMR